MSAVADKFYSLQKSANRERLKGIRQLLCIPKVPWESWTAALFLNREFGLSTLALVGFDSFPPCQTHSPASTINFTYLDQVGLLCFLTVPNNYFFLSFCLFILQVRSWELCFSLLSPSPKILSHIIFLGTTPQELWLFHTFNVYYFLI